ncbi:uncharacterized protein LOC144450009 [Glandiceps talaboti]
MASAALCTQENKNGLSNLSKERGRLKQEIQQGQDLLKDIEIDYDKQVYAVWQKERETTERLTEEVKKMSQNLHETLKAKYEEKKVTLESYQSVLEKLASELDETEKKIQTTESDNLETSQCNQEIFDKINQVIETRPSLNFLPRYCPPKSLPKIDGDLGNVNLQSEPSKSSIVTKGLPRDGRCCNPVQIMLDLQDEHVVAEVKGPDKKVRRLDVVPGGQRRDHGCGETTKTSAFGTHSTTFTAEKAGQYTVSVKVKNKHISGSPFEFKAWGLCWNVTLHKEFKPHSIAAKDKVVVLTDMSKNQIIRLNLDTDNGPENVTIKGPTTPPCPRGISVQDDDYLITDDHSRAVLVTNRDGKVHQTFGEEQIKNPCGIAVNSKGIVYVVDCNGHCIHTYKQGNDGKYEYRHSFGGEGQEEGQFSRPKSIAIDSKDNVIVSDSDNERVQVFNADGQFLFQFGHKGDEDGEFDNLRRLAVDTLDNIYVCDSNNNKVQKFDKFGRFVGQINRDVDNINKPSCVAVIGQGQGQGQVVVLDRSSEGQLKVYH